MIPRISLLCFVMTSWCVGAQNLEMLGKGNPFKISGGINGSSVFYRTNGIAARRDPFNYFMSGSLNVSVYGWSVPVSFSYANQRRSFNQPFNRYGLSPTYKGVTAHIGYRSLTFSNYTVSGHLFLGGGADIVCSDLVRVSGFYGRLRKAAMDTVVNALRRMGGGLKLAIGKGSQSADIILFKAKDDLSHYKDSIPIRVKPEENFVFSVAARTQVIERLTASAEYAASAITSDVRAEETTVHNPWQHAGGLFTTRTSSSFYNAFKSSVQYSSGPIAFGVAYEKVDPGYRTLGAYYFNNNLETYALTSSAVLSKNLRLNGQVGIQRNNLDHTELNTMQRLSASGSGNYQTSNKKAIFQASYSNFQAVENFRSPLDRINQTTPVNNLDTLKYRQVSANASLNASFVINDSKERRQNLSVSFSRQTSANQQGVASQPGSHFNNLNCTYTANVPTLNSTLVGSVNTSIIATASQTNMFVGPSFSARTSLLNKKLNVSLTISFNRSYAGRRMSAAILNMRATVGYAFNEKQSLDAGITRVNRFSIGANSESNFSEFTAQISYGHTF